jgi:outer membrane lipoprotein SlyB
MEAGQKSTIHPLVAGASVAVIIASLVGVAAMTGHLPGSNAEKAADVPAPVATPPVAVAPPETAQHKSATPDGARKQHVAAATPAPVAQAKHAVCADCGVVTEVKEVTVKGEGTGLGAVAGGVAGAVVGSQIGSGRGKVLAEVAGAAGGAYAGHQVEKYARSKKRYDVSVHLDDGSTKTVSFETAPSWRAGDKVKVVNDTLELRN